MKENFGTPKTVANDNNRESTANVESLEAWRTLQAEAPDRAETLVADEAPAFETLTPAKQIEALTALIDSLAHDNDNRYIAKELGVKLGRLIETQRLQERLAQIVA